MRGQQNTPSPPKKKHNETRAGLGVQMQCAWVIPSNSIDTAAKRWQLDSPLVLSPYTQLQIVCVPLSSCSCSALLSLEFIAYVDSYESVGKKRDRVALYFYMNHFLPQHGRNQGLPFWNHQSKTRFTCFHESCSPVGTALYWKVNVLLFVVEENSQFTMKEIMYVCGVCNGCWLQAYHLLTILH